VAWQARQRPGVRQASAAFPPRRRRSQSAKGLAQSKSSRPIAALVDKILAAKGANPQADLLPGEREAV